MSRYDPDDTYCYPGTNVLRNKFEVRDPQGLDALEADLSAVRLLQLADSPVVGQFDLQHLQKVHEHLFQDLYEWAGEIRTVDISRPGSRFANVNLIRSYAHKTFEHLAAENYLRDLSQEKIPERLAHYLSEINALHPFRDGNGRAQRAFIAQLAWDAGYFLDYADLTQESFYPAIELAFHGDERCLAKLIAQRLSTIESD